jgi:hypothetical protein
VSSLLPQDNGCEGHKFCKNGFRWYILPCMCEIKADHSSRAV